MASISKSFKKIIKNYINKYAYYERPSYKLLITHCDNIDINAAVEDIAHENTQKVFFIDCENCSYRDKQNTLRLMTMFKPEEVIVVFNNYVSRRQSDNMRDEMMELEKEIPNNIAKIAIINDSVMFTKMNIVLQEDRWLTYDYASWSKHIGVNDAEEINTHEIDDEDTNNENMYNDILLKSYIISRNVRGDIITDHEPGYFAIADYDDLSDATNCMVNDIYEFFKVKNEKELIALMDEFDKKDPYANGFFEKCSLVIKKDSAEYHMITREPDSIFTKEQVVTWRIEK